jgi:hypothetical protein
VIANLGLVGFGVCCFLGPVGRQWAAARALAWFWVGLESLNGLGHLGWSLLQLRYTPGLATAPILLPAIAVTLREAGPRLPRKSDGRQPPDRD